MTNMAKIFKTSSSEPVDQWPWNFACSIEYHSTNKIIQLMTLTYFMARSNMEKF